MDACLETTACEMLGDFFKTFANTTRMHIFCALQDGPKTVSEIARHAGITLPNASQHLRLMHDKGAVVMSKSSQNVYYAVADERILQAARLIREALLDRLRRQSDAAATI